MTLLVVTQIVDRSDPYLSFFHRWIEALASRFDQVNVICLKEGEHALPENVRVYSLGKEEKKEADTMLGKARQRIRYALRFLVLVDRLRTETDAVFVHMNEEYILLAGWFWKIFDIPVFLWRNHYAGSWRTDVAMLFCDAIFYTSRASYTAKYLKGVRMPVGVDAARFATPARVKRIPRSILFFARIAPSKRTDLFLDALDLLHRRDVPFSAAIVGNPLPDDEPYLAGLKERVRSLGLGKQVAFEPGIPNSQTPALYQAYGIYVNCARSGMLDKTIFEAAASDCLVLASSIDLKYQAGDAYSFDTAEELADKLEGFLTLSGTERDLRMVPLRKLVEANRLERLADRLRDEIMRDARD